MVFFGILAMFFNIFIFAGSVSAEETKETQIVVDENSLYQLAIEKYTSLDWRIKFPPRFNKDCIKSIISDYRSGNVKNGYMFECSPTETTFSLNQGGFKEIPNGEKWLMAIFENGPRFILIPNPEIRENAIMNMLEIIYFVSSLVLFGIVGYFYDYGGDVVLNKYFLAGILGVGALILVIFNNFILSFFSGFLVDMLAVMYFAVFFIFIAISVSNQIKPERNSLISVLIFFSAFLIPLTVLFSVGEFDSNWERIKYFFFQLLLIGLSWCFGEIVFAWRKEKLLKPKMVRANRIFHSPLNFIEEEHC